MLCWSWCWCWWWWQCINISTAGQLERRVLVSWIKDESGLSGLSGPTSHTCGLAMALHFTALHSVHTSFMQIRISINGLSFTSYLLPGLPRYLISTHYKYQWYPAIWLKLAFQDIISFCIVIIMRMIPLSSQVRLCQYWYDQTTTTTTTTSVKISSHALLAPTSLSQSHCFTRIL